MRRFAHLDLCQFIARALIISLIIGAADISVAKSPSGSYAGDAENISFRPYPPLLHPVRIGIARRSSSIRFAVWRTGALFVNGRPVFKIEPGRPYTFVGGNIIEMGTNRAYRLPTDSRPVVAASDYRIWVNNRWYRGSLEFINFITKATAINVLDLEDYLLGVVPSEMPSNWHPEALKAQAVAARSYAWAHTGHGSKWYLTEGFDLVPDVRDQAYKGLAAEANSTFWAVKLTQGIILKDSGRVKSGFYRAWVGDSFENLNIRKASVPSMLLEKITGVPKIVGITVKQWDAGANARSIQIIGQKKSREVDGVALAKMIGLTTAGVLDVQPSGANWIFTYRGPGNGVRGLSQHGANMFANRGWRFDQILHQYYQDPDGSLRLDNIDNYGQRYRTVTTSRPKVEAKVNKETKAEENMKQAKDSNDTVSDEKGKQSIED